MSDSLAASLRVAELAVHPLKSGRALACESASIGVTGFAGDRQFMLVDAAGHFVTQRGYPRLVLVALVPSEDGRTATLTLPEQPPLVVACDRWVARREVMIWSQWVPALVLDPRADRLLSDFLGAPVSLVRFPEDGERVADQPYAELTDRVAYADGFPFLVVGTASLEALNQRLDAQGAARVPMRRFRPNIVITTTEPFVEDRWRAITIGGIPFVLVKRCGRCVIVNVDPETGRSARGVLEALTAFRKEGNKVLFGQNAIHRGTGWLRVGDPVVVVDEGPPC